MYHTHRIVADMGVALDWFTKMAIEKSWKAMEVKFGPGKSTFVGMHPDAFKMILKAGETVSKPHPPAYPDIFARRQGSRKLVRVWLRKYFGPDNAINLPPRDSINLVSVVQIAPLCRVKMV